MKQLNGLNDIYIKAIKIKNEENTIMAEGNPILTSFEFKNEYNETITTAEVGDIVHAELTVTNIGDTDAIWTYILLDNIIEVYTDADSIWEYEQCVEYLSNESKTIITNSWVMIEESMTLGIYLLHYIKDYDPFTNWAPPNEYYKTIKNTQIYDFCQWIEDLGGPNNLTAYNIMQLVRAYLIIEDLGFNVQSVLIMAAVAYYLGEIEKGNELSGCDF